MKKLFEKWLCKHQWTSHSKKEYDVTDAFGRHKDDITREVLICSHCGKIKKIVY